MARKKATKPRDVNVGQFGEGGVAFVDRTTRVGGRRAMVTASTPTAKDLRRLAEFCTQAADWMEDGK